MVHGKIKEQSSKYNLLRYLQDHLNYIQKKQTSEMSIPNSLSPFSLIHESMALACSTFSKQIRKKNTSNL
jgi:hypothetical protein